MRLTRYGRGPAIAFGALLSAAVLLALSVWRAAAVGSVQARPLGDVDSEPPSALSSDTAVALDILAAVAQDPFHPERRRPGQRFRMPGERRSGSAPVQRTGLPESMRLIGTMVYQGGGGAAMLQEPGRPTRMLRVGERLDNLVLERVDREQAVFVTPTGSRVTIRVSKAGG